MARGGDEKGRARMELVLPAALKARLAREAFERGRPAAGIVEEALAGRLPPAPGATPEERAALWVAALAGHVECFPQVGRFGVADGAGRAAVAAADPQARAAALAALAALRAAVDGATAALGGAQLTADRPKRGRAAP